MVSCTHSSFSARDLGDPWLLALLQGLLYSSPDEKWATFLSLSTSSSVQLCSLSGVALKALSGAGFSQSWPGNTATRSSCACLPHRFCQFSEPASFSAHPLNEPDLQPCVRSAWILAPDSLPASYVSFINKHGGKHPLLIQTVKGVADEVRPIPGLDMVKSVYEDGGIHADMDPFMKIPCPVSSLFSVLLQ